MSKKLGAIFLAFVIIVGIFPSIARAEVGGEITRSLEFIDMPDDWSREAIIRAVDNGLLQGKKGKIKAEDDLLRAEMATIMNRAFNNFKKADISDYTDVKEDDWYYEEMAKAVYSKFFQGFKNKLKPEDPISREEAFVVISRAFMTESVTKEAPTGFKDLKDISEWAREDIYGLIEAGYVRGANGRINPKDHITRAEFAQLMANMVEDYLIVEGIYEEDLTGNVVVNKPGIILKDLTIEGDLILAEGMNSQDLVMENVKLEGRMVSRGAREVDMNGKTDLKRVVVDKINGETTSLVLDENSTIDELLAHTRILVKGRGTVKHAVLEKGAEGSEILTEGTDISGDASQGVKK